MRRSPHDLPRPSRLRPRHGLWLSLGLVCALALTHGAAAKPAPTESQKLVQIQGLSDRIGRWMIRNRYCDADTRLANLIPVDGSVSYVVLPIFPVSDINLSRNVIRRTFGREWPIGTVYVLAHEWAHKCDEIPVHEWNERREGLADLIAWDATKRICRLEFRGCVGGRFREHAGYYHLTVRWRKAGPKPWTGADARRWRRAQLQF